MQWSNLGKVVQYHAGVWMVTCCDNTLNEIMFFWPNLGQAWKGGNISHL